MRAVTSATAAAVLDIERKSLDNLLARLDSDELPKGRQGLERRIPVALLPSLFLAYRLAERLELSGAAAFRLARALERGEQPADPHLILTVDFKSIRREIDDQLEHTIESIVTPRRGRPRRA